MNLNKKIILFILVAVSFLVFYFLSFSLNSKRSDYLFNEYNKKEVQIGNDVFLAHVADTETLRAKGLSGSSGLKDNESMLFIFDVPNLHGFWMKDMLFPIDIAWIDENFKIISIEENVLPESYPLSFFPSDRALYVMEFSAGTLKDREIFVGEVIKITDKE